MALLHSLIYINSTISCTSQCGKECNENQYCSNYTSSYWIRVSGKDSVRDIRRMQRYMVGGFIQIRVQMESLTSVSLVDV